VSGERFEVSIESLDQEGRGVAHRDGKEIFVEGALPGESVVYERRRNKARYESGRAISIASESSMRVSPRCPHAGLHAGACGGCSMQHINARAQVAVKQRVLEDTLESNNDRVATTSIGGGVDMVTACDLRYATADAYFTVHEINTGMTAAVGTFPRLVKLIPEGVARELGVTDAGIRTGLKKFAGVKRRFTTTGYWNEVRIVASGVELTR